MRSVDIFFSSFSYQPSIDWDRLGVRPSKLYLPIHKKGTVKVLKTKFFISLWSCSSFNWRLRMVLLTLLLAWMHQSIHLLASNENLRKWYIQADNNKLSFTVSQRFLSLSTVLWYFSVPFTTGTAHVCNGRTLWSRTKRISWKWVILTFSKIYCFARKR